MVDGQIVQSVVSEEMGRKMGKGMIL